MLNKQKFDSSSVLAPTIVYGATTKDPINDGIEIHDHVKNGQLEEFLAQSTRGVQTSLLDNKIFRPQQGLL